MDCIYRRRENDWGDIYRDLDSGMIDKYDYKIFNHDSMILHITDKKFKKNIEKILSEYREENIEYERIFIDFVLNKYDEAYYFYLFNEEKIIGMCKGCNRNKKIEIVNVFIIKEFRRMNLGFFMMSNLIKFLKKQNIIKIGLSVEKSNLPALNLYKKLNFEIECEKYEECFGETYIYMYYPIKEN